MSLTLEQKATNFETCQHIQKVQHFLHKFVKELLSRAELHDRFDMSKQLVKVFENTADFLEG